MIKVSSLINLLKKNNSNFFTGVPDSVLKELSSDLQNKNKKKSYHCYKRRCSCIIGNWSLSFHKECSMYLYAKFWPF